MTASRRRHQHTCRVSTSLQGVHKQASRSNVAGGRNLVEEFLGRYGHPTASSPRRVGNDTIHCTVVALYDWGRVIKAVKLVFMDVESIGNSKRGCGVFQVDGGSESLFLSETPAVSA